MYEIPTGDYNAQREAEKIGAVSTLGVGRTAPLGWMDGANIHENLKGVQLVSRQSEPKDTLNFVSHFSDHC